MRVFGLQWNITSFASGRPLWTLAVEWWLYMFFGWLYLKIIRMSDYSFRSLLILLVLSIAPIAHATFARGESLTLMFMLGAVIAVFSTQIGVLKTYVWALLFALSVTLFTLRIIHSNNFYDLQGAIFIAVAFGALIGLARATRVIEDLPRHVISTIKLLAGMSYALYATHYSIIEFIRVWSIEVEYSLILFVLCSHVVAFVIYFVFDRNHKRFAMFLGRNVWKTSNA
jgi:peptidoglycan/LPS O-acetylase OafA/YrhL